MKSRWSTAFLAAVLTVLAAGFASAQDESYTVVAVTPDGIVLKGPTGTAIYDVPAGTMFNADGNTVALADLKPGMKVTGKSSAIGSWGTTKVMVNQALNAEVVAVTGNSILIRGPKGVNKYEWKDASDFRIMKDGVQIDPSSLKVGDRITGMIVAKAGPHHTAAPAAAPAAVAAAPAPAPKPTHAPPPPAPAAAAAPAPAPAAAPAPAPAPAKKKLPKTASEIPLVGLMGALSLAAGVGLSLSRKSRSAK
jgi:hypothetical protein